MKNKGRQQRRFRGNSMEKEFAKTWEMYNTYPTGRLSGRGTLDYLLAEDCTQPAGEVTPRDREVAATVIQWLGSPVGQQFVRDVMKVEEKT